MVQDTQPSSTVSIGSLLEEVMDEILEGFQIISSDWKYIYLNDVVVKQSTKAREELLGRTMMECFPGIEQTPLFTEMSRCMNEHISIRMDNEFTFPNGSKGWFQLCIHPWMGGILIFSIDITHRKQVETAFQKGLGDLEVLIHNVSENDPSVQNMRQVLNNLRLSIPSSAAEVMKSE